jgi:uridine phosphorylase
MTYDPRSQDHDLSDSDAAVIDPRRGKREKDLPASAVLIFSPQDLNLFFGCFPEPPRRSHRLYLSDVYTVSHRGMALALAGPMLGAPQTILVLEKLIALGVQNIVAVGWCGSLQPEVHIGDVVLPVGAVSEEGTSTHYPIPVADPGPSEALRQPLKAALTDQALRVHEGRIWSTDAPFRETVGKVRAYQQQGVLAVEMESSALFTVACYRSVRLAVALVVSDALATLKWVHGFRDERFLRTREATVQTTLEVVCTAFAALDSV